MGNPGAGGPGGTGMRIENRAPERNPRSVPVPSRSSALGNGDEARFLDRCAEGGASGIPDDHRSRQGDRVGGYLRLLKGKAESAPPAPHDGPGAGHHRPGAGRPVLPQEQRAHRRPGLVLPEHGPGIALTVSQMQMLPVPIRVRTPTKNGQWLVSPLAVQLLKQPDPHGTSSVKSA